MRMIEKMIGEYYKKKSPDSKSKNKNYLDIGCGWVVVFQHLKIRLSILWILKQCIDFAKSKYINVYFIILQ